jgi:hypothetical protein
MGARSGRWRGWVFICEGLCGAADGVAARGGSAWFDMMLSPLLGMGTVHMGH